MCCVVCFLVLAGIASLPPATWPNGWYVQALHRRNGWYVQTVERRTARDGELHDEQEFKHLQEKGTRVWPEPSRAS